MAAKTQNCYKAASSTKYFLCKQRRSLYDCSSTAKILKRSWPPNSNRLRSASWPSFHRIYPGHDRIAASTCSGRERKPIVRVVLISNFRFWGLVTNRSFCTDLLDVGEWRTCRKTFAYLLFYWWCVVRLLPNQVSQKMELSHCSKQNKKKSKPLRICEECLSNQRLVEIFFFQGFWRFVGEQKEPIVMEYIHSQLCDTPKTYRECSEYKLSYVVHWRCLHVFLASRWGQRSFIYILHVFWTFQCLVLHPSVTQNKVWVFCCSGAFEI